MTIRKKNSYFKEYLFSKLDVQVVLLLEHLKSCTDVYIFSGIIRDFFLNKESIRDLDLVLGDRIDLTFINRHYFPHIKITRNNFGGYKVVINNFRIDIWSIDSTWGIIKEEKSATRHSLINSAFFNFSTILYWLNREEFYCEDTFINFLNKKVIDVVYEYNPNIPLCIINSLYYKNRLSLPLSPNLKRWIKQNFSPDLDFDKIQLNHFGEIIYSQSEINDFLIFCALDNKTHIQ